MRGWRPVVATVVLVDASTAAVAANVGDSGWSSIAMDERVRRDIAGCNGFVDMTADWLRRVCDCQGYRSQVPS
jgi:hypothetical protein